jgi:hypothetical protein
MKNPPTVKQEQETPMIVVNGQTNSNGRSANSYEHDGDVKDVGANGKAMRKRRPQSIRNGWFTEIEPSWPGQRLSLALEVRIILCKQQCFLMEK